MRGTGAVGRASGVLPRVMALLLGTEDGLRRAASQASEHDRFMKAGVFIGASCRRPSVVLGRGASHLLPRDVRSPATQPSATRGVS